MSESTLKPFGACLTDLLAKHNLPAATVSRMLGHKSRTTLRRILQDQANAESMEKFLSDFLAVRLIPLNASEESGLRQSLEISRIGIASFRSQLEMWKLLQNSLHTAAPRTVYLNDVQSGVQIPLAQFFDSLSEAESIRLLIINSVPGPFFDELRRFIDRTPDCRIEAEHYLFQNDDMARTVQFIAAVLPTLDLPCYSAYTIPPPHPEQPQFNILTASIMAFQIRTPSGEETEYQLGFTSFLLGQLLRFPGSTGICAFWRGMIEPSLPMRISAKTVFSTPATLSDCLRLSQSYYELERNHAVYMLKPGISYSMIEPSLLRAPLMDGALAGPLLNDPDRTALLHQLHELQTLRFHNMYAKKRVTHIVLPLQSMRSFVLTGRLSDHFYALRPFTVGERRQILTFFRDQCRDNPYFNVHFLKNDAVAIDLEATCYEPDGVLFHSAGHAYAAGHADALITLDEFTALFARFFCESLLPHMALSVSASVSVLDSLIDELPDE